MADVLYPHGRDSRGKPSYTKETVGEPYERGQEPTVILSPLDVLAIQVMAEALNGEDAEYVAPEADPA
jgi:hypothetical protein